MTTLEHIEVVVVLAALIIAIVFFVQKVVNKSLNQAEKKAREHIVKRLRQRERIDLEDFLEGLNIREDHFAFKVKTLIENIAKEITVSPELLRPNDRLVELVRVYPGDLDAEGQKAWKKAKRMLRDHLDVDIYEILYEIEQFTDSGAVGNNLMKPPEDKRPKCEEEWIELILPMALEEIIRFFGGRTDVRS